MALYHTFYLAWPHFQLSQRTAWLLLRSRGSQPFLARFLRYPPRYTGDTLRKVGLLNFEDAVNNLRTPYLLAGDVGGTKEIIDFPEIATHFRSSAGRKWRDLQAIIYGGRVSHGTQQSR